MSIIKPLCGPTVGVWLGLANRARASVAKRVLASFLFRRRVNVKVAPVMLQCRLAEWGVGYFKNMLSRGQIEVSL